MCCTFPSSYWSYHTRTCSCELRHHACFFKLRSFAWGHPWWKLPWNFQDDTFFSKKLSQFEATKIVHEASGPWQHFFPVSWCLKVVLSHICGFLITWGIPYKFSLNTALGSAFVLVFVSINSYWKRIKEGKCWPEDFLVVCLLFKNELVSMGSRGSTCHSRTRLPSTPTRSHGRQNIRDRIRSWWRRGRADAWKQDRKCVGRHWGATLIY